MRGRGQRSGSPLAVTADPIAPAELTAVRERWEGLATASNASPYLTFGWLESWALVYEPRALILLQVTHPERGLVAIGLLEQRRFGALQFGGLPVTALRSLLALPEYADQAWLAVAEWLRGRPSWSALNGLVAGNCVLPGAILTPAAWLRLELPDDFEQYLSQREPGPRREFRRRLRVAEREGAVISMLGQERVRDGLEAFTSLHQARARAKGETHRTIDDRLVRMLTHVSGHAQPELRTFVLERDGTLLGVAIQIDHAGETCAYNTGFDPAAARLAPGTLLRLASIRDAIERGGRWFDFGPGDFPYKRALGGRPATRSRMDTASGAFVNGLMGLRIRGEHRLRQATPLRRGVKRLRELRARRLRGEAGG